MATKALHLAGMVMVIAAAAGCRSATRVVDVPRIDLELSGNGNRGYLVGTPSSTPDLQADRRIVETEVEVPAFRKLKDGAAPLGGVEALSSPESYDILSEDSEGTIPQSFDSYTVKRKDTLWSIAGDPAIYGDGSKWRVIYNANRDLLKSPDRLRAGMTLRIPRGDSAAPAEPVTWTK